MSLLVAASAVLAFSTLDNENCLSAKTDGSFMLPNLIDTVSGVSAVQSNYEMLLETPIVAIDSNKMGDSSSVCVKADTYVNTFKCSKTWQAECTWYGKEHHGNKTASGKVFNMYELTAAASSKIPLWSKVKVTNISNGKSVIVTITDRGGFAKKTPNNLDLSYAAFKKICNKSPHVDGRLKIKIEVL